MKSYQVYLKRMAYPYLFWLSLFILFPIVLVFWFSIHTNTGKQYTLDNYLHFFTSTGYLRIFGRSFLLALYTTLLCLLIGYPAAYILSSMKGRKRNVLLLLIILPMWANMLLRVYAWVFLIGNNGLINLFIERLNRYLPFSIPTISIMYSPQAVLLGMVYSYLPFMILPIYSVLVKLDKDLLHAAYDLGATKAKAFLKITLPLSMPGIISGVTMVFLPAATSFIVPTYLGGTELYIGNLIERQFKVANNWNFGSAISILLVVVIFIFIGLANHLSGDQERGESLW